MTFLALLREPDKFINESSVVCCLATMALYLFQSTNEVATTPFTDRYLGFTSTQNAYVYSITGTLNILVL